MKFLGVEKLYVSGDGSIHLPTGTYHGNFHRFLRGHSVWIYQIGDSLSEQYLMRPSLVTLLWAIVMLKEEGRNE